MESNKNQSATTAMMADQQLRERIERLSLAYVGFFEGLLESPESIDRETVHALNDCVRVLHHLMKINSYTLSHS